MRGRGYGCNIVRDSGLHKTSYGGSCQEESAGELSDVSKITKVTIKISLWGPFSDYDIVNDHLAGVVDDRKMKAVPTQDMSQRSIKALVSDGRSWDLDTLDLD